MAVKTLDHLGARGVIDRYHLGEILRIELLAESRRFDEVAEDNGEVPAFRARRRLLLLGNGLRFYGSSPGRTWLCRKAYARPG
jgi:hypothetical protein